MLNNVSKNKMNNTANIEQLLFYLDEMRRTFANNKDVDCKIFLNPYSLMIRLICSLFYYYLVFNQDALIAMLVQLKQICTSQQKTKYVVIVIFKHLIRFNFLLFFINISDMLIFSQMCLAMIMIMAIVVMVRIPVHPVPHRLHRNQDHKEKRIPRIQRQRDLKRRRIKNHRIRIRLPIIPIRNPILQRLVTV